ncbi:hypothetical protein [Adlercreutzia equolifaciens]|uniref:hypothetical protein n=1 Tax=Adlercreutzia equolifaciens TaxID=446660 RepID=UPI003522E650
MSRLKIYGPCLDCCFRDLAECSITYFDKDLPMEFGPSRRQEVSCLKEPVCKKIEGLEPIEWEEADHD